MLISSNLIGKLLTRVTLGSTPKTTGKIEKNYLISNENSSFMFKKFGQSYSSGKIEKNYLISNENSIFMSKKFGQSYSSSQLKKGQEIWSSLQFGIPYNTAIFHNNPGWRWEISGSGI